VAASRTACYYCLVCKSGNESFAIRTSLVSLRSMVLAIRLVAAVTDGHITTAYGHASPAVVSDANRPICDSAAAAVVYSFCSA